MSENYLVEEKGGGREGPEPENGGSEGQKTQSGPPMPGRGLA